MTSFDLDLETILSFATTLPPDEKLDLFDSRA